MVAPFAAEALIERIIAQARARMIRRERIVTGALLGAYERSWRSIDRELRLLETQYRQALRAGIDVTPEWITRQAYWRGLQSSIEAEFVRFEGNASRVLAAGQAEAVTAARQDAIALLEGLGLPGIGGELRPARMERWVSALQPRSPLRGVIRRYGAGVQTAIQDEITEGLGMGRGSSSVIRSIRDRIGPEAMTPRINTLVRTEMHRTYRGAQREQYDALKDDGIIVGYRWQASLSPRTCGACLAMHGRVFDEYPSGHHPNCRCTVRPVVDPELLPGGSAPAASGEDWLRQQDERTKLLALGSRGRLEAFREGASLESMVTIRDNKTWGPSVGLTRPGRGGGLPGEFNRGSGGAGSGSAPDRTLAVGKPTGYDAAMERIPSGLTPEEDQAWREYKNFNYRGLNRSLRERGYHDLPAGAFRKTDHMDMAFERLGEEIEAPTRVLRGARQDVRSDPWAGIGPGGTIHDPGYLSTTFDGEIAEKFLSGGQEGTVSYLFDLDVPAGARYIPGDIWASESLTGVESELIFARGSTIRVREVVREGDAVTVRGELVPAKPVSTASVRPRSVDDFLAQLDQAFAGGAINREDYEGYAGWARSLGSPDAAFDELIRNEPEFRKTVLPHGGDE